MADVHKPFFGQRQERVPYGAGFDPLELVQFGNRWESVTGSELRRPDRCPQFVSDLLPRGSRVGRVGPEIRDVRSIASGIFPGGSSPGSGPRVGSVRSRLTSRRSADGQIGGGDTPDLSDQLQLPRTTDRLVTVGRG